MLRSDSIDDFAAQPSLAMTSSASCAFSPDAAANRKKSLVSSVQANFDQFARREAKMKVMSSRCQSLNGSLQGTPTHDHLAPPPGALLRNNNNSSSDFDSSTSRRGSMIDGCDPPDRRRATNIMIKVDDHDAFDTSTSVSLESDDDDLLDDLGSSLRSDRGSISVTAPRGGGRGGARGRGGMSPGPTVRAQPLHGHVASAEPQADAPLHPVNFMGGMDGSTSVPSTPKGSRGGRNVVYASSPQHPVSPRHGSAQHHSAAAGHYGASMIHRGNTLHPNHGGLNNPDHSVSISQMDRKTMEARQRAADLRKQEMEQKEKLLQESKMRQAEASERKHLFEEQRTVQRALCWEAIVFHIQFTRVCGKLLVEGRRQEKMKHKFLPHIAIYIRRPLRRARLKLYGKGAKRPAIASLRFDKMLNLFSDAHLQFLIDNLQLRYYFENETIIFMGSEDDEGYVLHQGTADVMMGSVKVFTMKAGMSFGTVGMISGEPRTASIVAREPCLVWYITRGKFESYGARDDKVAAALQIIAELRETNMRNVYKGMLCASFLSTFPIFTGVAEEVLSALVKMGTPKVLKPGSVVISPSHASHGSHILVLRGTIRVYCPPKISLPSDVSFAEALCQLIDLPRKSKAHTDNTIVELAKAYEDRCQQEDATHEIVRNRQTHRSSSVAAVAQAFGDGFGSDPFESSTNNAGGSTIMAPPQFGTHAPTVQKSGSIFSPFGGNSHQTSILSITNRHVFDLNGPFLLNIAPVFLQTQSPFMVECAGGLDVLSIPKDAMISQDVLELAVIRQNCYNIRCPFMPQLNKAQFVKALFRTFRCPSVPLNFINSAIKEFDSIPMTRWVFGHHDFVPFDPAHNMEALIVLNGELEGSGGAAGFGRPSGSSGKCSSGARSSGNGGTVSMGGSPEDLPFLWPPLPFVYYGNMDLMVRVKSQRLEVLKVLRCELIRWMCDTFSDPELQTLIQGITEGYLDLNSGKRPIFSQFGVEAIHAGGIRGRHRSVTKNELMSAASSKQSGGGSMTPAAQQRLQTLEHANERALKILATTQSTMGSSASGLNSSGTGVQGPSSSRPVSPNRNSRKGAGASRSHSERNMNDSRHDSSGSGELDRSSSIMSNSGSHHHHQHHTAHISNSIRPQILRDDDTDTRGPSTSDAIARMDAFGGDPHQQRGVPHKPPVPPSKQNPHSPNQRHPPTSSLAPNVVGSGGASARPASSKPSVSPSATALHNANMSSHSARHSNDDDSARRGSTDSNSGANRRVVKASKAPKERGSYIDEDYRKQMRHRDDSFDDVDDFDDDTVRRGSRGVNAHSQQQHHRGGGGGAHLGNHRGGASSAWQSSSSTSGSVSMSDERFEELLASMRDVPRDESQRHGPPAPSAASSHQQRQQPAFQRQSVVPNVVQPHPSQSHRDDTSRNASPHPPLSASQSQQRPRQGGGSGGVSTSMSSSTRSPQTTAASRPGNASHNVPRHGRVGVGDMSTSSSSVSSNSGLSTDAQRRRVARLLEKRFEKLAEVIEGDD